MQRVRLTNQKATASDPGVPSTRRVRLAVPIQGPDPAREQTVPLRRSKVTKRAPNKLHLTERNVITLRLRPTPYLCWDEGTDAAKGLCVQVQPTGVRSFKVQYHYKGSSKSGYVTIGRVGELSVEEARATCRAIRGRVAKGLDPVEDPSEGQSFKAVVNMWFELEHNQKVSSDENIKLLLNNTTSLHGRPISGITYRELETLLHAKAKVSPSSANRLHAHLSTFFRWCMRSRRLSSNPMYEHKRPAPVPEPRTRPWFFGEAGDAMIVKLWRFADEVGGDQGSIIKLLIITGKRKNAVEDMSWSNIDARTWLWSPPSRSKAKHNQSIVLPQLARRVLGRHQGDGKVFGYVNMEILSKRVKDEVVSDFFWHGIRHIVTTKLRELRVHPWIARIVLDHKVFTDAHAGYEHGDQSAEMLEALERWCSHVEKLIQPEGVAVLR